MNIVFDLPTIISIILAIVVIILAWMVFALQ